MFHCAVFQKKRKCPGELHLRCLSFARASTFVASGVSGEMPSKELKWKTESMNGNLDSQTFQSETSTQFTYGTDTTGNVNSIHFIGTQGSEGTFFSDAGISVLHPKHSLNASGFSWDVSTGQGTFENAVTRGEK
jgi:hypothetical protein